MKKCHECKKPAVCLIKVQWTEANLKQYVCALHEQTLRLDPFTPIKVIKRIRNKKLAPWCCECSKKLYWRAEYVERMGWVHHRCLASAIASDVNN